MKSIRLFAFILGVLACTSAGTGAASLTVANTDNSGPDSLRQAIDDAESGDTIIFDPALSGQTFTLASELRLLDKNLGIDASGLANGLRLDGNGSSRILYVNSGAQLTLKNLSFSGGNGGGAVYSGDGGAILNQGTLALTNCTLGGNSAAFGGAIYNEGTLEVNQSTVSGNTAGLGGAIFNYATLTVTQSTVSANTAEFGGGIDSFSLDPITLNSTIVAGNDGGNIRQANFEGAGAGSNNLTAGDPLLAPLDSYGGPTQTMALRPGSPARDAGGPTGFVTDQRGFPITGTPDIGAYEAGTFSDYDAFIWETLPATTSAGDRLATFDFDGDGASNGDEWSALTHPADPASVLRITQSIVDDPNMSVIFPTVIGRNYTLEYSFTLGSWSPVVGATYAGTGAPLTATFGPVTGHPAFFVRVRVGP